MLTCQYYADFLLHMQLPIWFHLPSHLWCIWHFSEMKVISAFVLSIDLFILGLQYSLSLILQFLYQLQMFSYIIKYS